MRPVLPSPGYYLHRVARLDVLVGFTYCPGVGILRSMERMDGAGLCENRVGQFGDSVEVLRVLRIAEQSRVSDGWNEMR